MFIIVNRKGYNIEVNAKGVRLLQDSLYFSTIKEISNYITSTCNKCIHKDCDNCPIYLSEYKITQSHPTPPTTPQVA